jgi:hypothetical protein
MSKIRVCELLPGDEFSIMEIHYIVDRIERGRVYYRQKLMNWNGRKYPSARWLTIGSKSQQFVNLLSDAGNRINKKVVPPDPEIVGPAADKGSAR